jgi:DEAD/DEAH box helicase domain-containing protein
LAERIGIEDREIGWACLPARDPATGVQTRSVVLYDTASGGAGFVAQAVPHLPSLLRRAATILTCPQDCDAACQSCLLGSDTWYSVDRLNRHEALAVLTDTFRSALELPAESRVFGETTLVEFEPVETAISRELRHASRNSLRLVLAGEPLEWELEEWALQHRLGRWVSEGVSVELIVPEDVMARIDAPSRNKLAAWSDAGLATIVEVNPAALIVGNGSLIAEVGGGRQGATRFAVLTADHLTPGNRWGTGHSAAHVLRASVDAAPSALPGRVCSGDALRVTPGGTVAPMTVTTELNGSVSEIGARFWNMVLEASPALKERLESGEPIHQVAYEDRYVTSPLAMRAVVEVMKGLRIVARAAMGGALVHLRTVPITSPSRDYRWISSSWNPSDDRNRIFAVASASAGLRGEFSVAPKHQSPHARELAIHWADGACWKMRLDEGFGFLQCRPRPGPSHNFTASYQEQGAALLSSRFDVESRIETYFYVFAITAG